MQDVKDISIYVPAIPIAQPRPRAVTVANRSMIVGNPVRHPVTAYKATCRHAASQVYTGAPLDQPLCLTLLFILPRPKAMFWKRKPMPRVPHTKGHPDLDNLVKATQDALNGLIWRDDGLIWHTNGKKLIAAGDEQPHTEIVIWDGSNF